MKRNLLLCLLTTALCHLLFAQDLAHNGEKQDFRNEAIVVEQHHLASRFENDGTGTHRLTVGYRVQSEAGVQQLGVLTLPYDLATGDIEIAYVRVRKPDGTVVTTPIESAQDMPAAVSREAPIYSDLREKHINMVNLRPGDVLEYELLNRVTKPLISNQFWLDISLERNLITLDQRVELDVPSNRAIKLKVKSGYEPNIREEAGRKIYVWTHSNLRHSEAKPSRQEVQAEFTPDVQVTSFVSWQELGLWFSEIQKDRIVPSVEVQAKAAELTRNKLSEREKIEALYNFVSQNIRYIGLEFGIGRFQANRAASILANSYGDCKDKHTLLASLLQAIGVTTQPVLIHINRKLDSDIPSPAQFDHVITAVVVDKKRLFLDTSPEVAPFGMLLVGLRDKDALTIGTNGSTEIVRTPTDTPFPQFIHLDVEGAVDKDGKVTAQITQTFRGDEELLFRLALRRTSSDKWKDVAQYLAHMTGYGGEVSGVSVANLENTSKPLQVKYGYTRQGYITWEGNSGIGTMRIALPGMELPDPMGASEQKNEPVRFARRTELVYSGTLLLPEDVRATEPAGLNLVRPYAAYDSTYELKRHAISIRRTLTLKATEGPPLSSADYKSFYDDVSRDYSRNLAIYQAARQEHAERAQQQKLPDPAAEEAFRSGVQAATRGDLFGARAKH